VILLIAMPVQFAYFCHDYFTDYQARSAFWFDPVNFRGVAEYLVARSETVSPPRIYLRDDLDDVVARWRFYLAKHRREDLLTRTRLLAGTGLDVGPCPRAAFSCSTRTIRSCRRCSRRSRVLSPPRSPA
jgi:hypothetical protein